MYEERDVCLLFGYEINTTGVQRFDIHNVELRIVLVCQVCATGLHVLMGKC